MTIAIAACGGGTVTDGSSGPTTPTDTTKPPTTVQRASLTVRVTIDPSDANVSTSAGLTNAGITVHITRGTPALHRSRPPPPLTAASRSRTCWTASTT